MVRKWGKPLIKVWWDGAFDFGRLSRMIHVLYGPVKVQISYCSYFQLVIIFISSYILPPPCNHLVISLLIFFLFSSAFSVFWNAMQKLDLYDRNFHDLSKLLDVWVCLIIITIYQILDVWVCLIIGHAKNSIQLSCAVVDLVWEDWVLVIGWCVVLCLLLRALATCYGLFRPKLKQQLEKYSFYGQYV